MLQLSVVSCLLVVAIATVICSCNAQREENVIEIKTEAPPPSAPSPSVVSHQRFQDCNEFLYGKLHGIRQHGTTWQNSAKDCSNCTCDNGDIRCFFHFCYGPPTGYMTPPSSLRDAFSSISDSDDPTTITPSDIFLDEIADDDAEEEESSGFFPYDDSEGDEDALWSLFTEKEEKDDLGWPDREIPPSGSPANPIRPHSEGLDLESRGKGVEPHLNSVKEETFCGGRCNKVCPKGFKLDVKRDCLKCRCKKQKCSKKFDCDKFCPLGFLRDPRGCRRCACLPPPPTLDEDIVFEEFEDRKPPPRGERGEFPRPFPRFLPEEDLHLLIDDDEEEEEDRFRPHPNDIHYPPRGNEPYQPEEQHQHEGGEPCNTTTKSPYDDADSNRGYFLEAIPLTAQSTGQVDPIGYDDDSRLDILAKNIVENNHMDTNDATDEATIKSVVKADHSQLIMILVPMGVLFTLATLLLTHFWRRYHRDKYDINSYRPEEKEILHPVKTLQDDQASLKHV